MPELPEVETVCRGLAALIGGDVIRRVELRRADLRFPFPAGFARRLAGRRIERVARRAKYLLWHLDDDAVLIAHLGMSGSFRVEGEAGSAGLGTLYRGATKDRRHDHVIIHMASARQVIYNDPRRFGLMDLAAAGALETSRHLANLGLEPLDPAFDGSALAAAFAGRRTPMKAALLDQRLVAGIGNIYACEALWRARLSPDRPAMTLLTPGGRVATRAGRLAAAIRAVLGEAIVAGGSSLRDHMGASGEIGAFQTRFAVYDREGVPCPRPWCRGSVRRVSHAGRSTFYCRACQR